MPESTALPVGRPYQKLDHHFTCRFSEFDLNNTLASKQNHLLALLYVISAEDSEVFTHLPESIQSLYLHCFRVTRSIIVAEKNMTPPKFPLYWHQ